MFSKWSEAYHAMKSHFRKLDFPDFHDIHDMTSGVVGPFSMFMGVYTIMSDASNDLLSVTKEQNNHVKEIRRILDPSGYGSSEEVPDLTRVRRALLWFQEQELKLQNTGARALSLLKPPEVSTTNEGSAKEFVDIIFGTF